MTIYDYLLLCISIIAACLLETIEDTARRRRIPTVPSRFIGLFASLVSLLVSPFLMQDIYYLLYVILMSSCAIDPLRLEVTPGSLFK